MPANIYFGVGKHKKVVVPVLRPDNVVAVADNITARGFRLRIEDLPSGAIALTIYDPEIDQHASLWICERANINKGVDKIILGFDIARALKQRATARDPKHDD